MQKARRRPRGRAASSSAAMAPSRRRTRARAFGVSASISPASMAASTDRSIAAASTSSAFLMSLSQLGRCVGGQQWPKRRGRRERRAPTTPSRRRRRSFHRCHPVPPGRGPVSWGQQVTGLAWAHRRELLEVLELNGAACRTVPTFDGDPQVVLEACAHHELEGLVAKRTDAIYEPGRRSRC